MLVVYLDKLDTWKGNEMALGSADLFEAAKKGDVAGVQAALQHTHIDAKESVTGMTALHYAAGFDRSAVMDFLIEEGADANIWDQSDQTPMMILRNTSPEQYATYQQKIHDRDSSNASNPSPDCG